MIPINTPATQFKWAKSISLSDTIYVISFSADGLLIGTATEYGKIIVCDSNDGRLKTSRSF